jgi:ubiquinone/menaquinone biosynthesis C-methylase UbiE
VVHSEADTITRRKRVPGIGFDRAAQYYDSTRGFPEGVAEQIRDAIVAYTHADRQTRVLELGVGTGRIAVPFIRAGYDFIGVDISQAMMDQLTRKLAADPDPHSYRYRLLQADVTHLPLPDQSVDLAIAVHVLHLVSDWQTALREARRVLRRPGGWLLIASDEPARESGESSADRIVNSRWDAILDELGHGRAQWLPGVDVLPLESRAASAAHSAADIAAYLQELAAAVEIVTLLAHPTAPLSPRAMAQRHAERKYAHDWRLPDDIHAEAVRRLQRWLDTECPEPDRATNATNEFRAITARWAAATP